MVAALARGRSLPPGLRLASTRIDGMIMQTRGKARAPDGIGHTPVLEILSGGGSPSPLRGVPPMESDEGALGIPRPTLPRSESEALQAAEARPLSLANSGSTLLASALQGRDPVVDSVLSPRQFVFQRSVSILTPVAEVHTALHRAAC